MHRTLCLVSRLVMRGEVNRPPVLLYIILVFSCAVMLLARVRFKVPGENILTGWLTNLLIEFIMAVGILLSSVWTVLCDGLAITIWVFLLCMRRIVRCCFIPLMLITLTI